MPSGISHFAIKVRDVEAAERFYSHVLGLRVERRWPHPSGEGVRSVWLDTGDAAGTFVALEAVGRDATDSNSLDVDQDTEALGHHLLALRIGRDQRAEFEERLRSAGVQVSHRTRYTLYFRDGEGNRLAVSHYPETSETLEAEGAGMMMTRKTP